MNEKEILETRCILARIIDIPPDDIDVFKMQFLVDDTEDDKIIFDMPYENGTSLWHLGLSFDHTPSLDEAKNSIDTLISTMKDLEEEL